MVGEEKYNPKRIEHCIDRIKHLANLCACDEAMVETILRRGIPVKPVGKHTQKRCGVCGTRIRSGAGSSSFTRDTVCRNCYTLIDWGGDADD